MLNSRFHVKKMVEDLHRHGLYRFKDDEEMPNIDANFMNHFLRGYLDGDGTVYFNLTGTEGKWPRALVGFAGDKKILESINQILFTICGANINKVYHRTNIHCVNWSGCRQSLNILRWLYKNSTENTRLDRKYQIYIRMEEWFSDSATR